MPFFDVNNTMELDANNNTYNAEAGENLQSIAISLFIIQGQLAEFKENLISAKNLVRLNGINMFEDKLLKLRNKFNMTDITDGQLTGPRYQSISDRLKSILQIIIEIKQQSSPTTEDISLSRMDEMEHEIEILISMLDQ